MARTKKIDSLRLLRWTKELPNDKSRDPLGLSLRVSFRLADKLLRGITTTARRARYYSFFPWAIDDYVRHERGTSRDRGLARALLEREKALVVGSLLRHDGQPCPGGALGGSDAAQEFVTGSGNSLDLTQLKHLENKGGQFGAAYKGSLINLELFVSHDTAPEAEREETGAEADGEPQGTDFARLSERGKRLATAYDLAVRNTHYVRHHAAAVLPATAATLRGFGQSGCLCALADASAPDRSALRELFFDVGGTSRRTVHHLRRMSLLLILEAARQFAQNGLRLGENTFRQAVYYGQVFAPEEAESPGVVPLSWPDSLVDVVERWRIFYFHFYLTSALEALLVGVVSATKDRPEGVGCGELLAPLGRPSVRKRMEGWLSVPLPTSLLAATPQEFLTAVGARIGSSAVPDILSPRSEEKLYGCLWEEREAHSEAGMGVAVLLLHVLLAQYEARLGTPYDAWYRNHTRKDCYSVSVPGVLDYLVASFGDWHRTAGDRLLPMLLNRFVLHQHEVMAFEREFRGTTLLFNREGDHLRWSGYDFPNTTAGNARLGSALQILTDLGLLEREEDGAGCLTTDGRTWLRRLLDEEAAR